MNVNSKMWILNLVHMVNIAVVTFLPIVLDTGLKVSRKLKHPAFACTELQVWNGLEINTTQFVRREEWTGSGENLTVVTAVPESMQEPFVAGRACWPDGPLLNSSVCMDEESPPEDMMSTTEETASNETIADEISKDETATYDTVIDETATYETATDKTATVDIATEEMDKWNKTKCDNEEFEYYDNEDYEVLWDYEGKEIFRFRCSILLTVNKYSYSGSHWADLVIESPCPSVCLFVCLSVFLSVPLGAVIFRPLIGSEVT